jgi:hypothetical protein
MTQTQSFGYPRCCSSAMVLSSASTSTTITTPGALNWLSALCSHCWSRFGCRGCEATAAAFEFRLSRPDIPDLADFCSALSFPDAGGSSLFEFARLWGRLLHLLRDWSFDRYDDDLRLSVRLNPSFASVVLKRVVAGISGYSGARARTAVHITSGSFRPGA